MSFDPNRCHSYHRTEARAQQVADSIGGHIITGEHPNPEYGGLLVWWVIEVVA